MPSLLATGTHATGGWTGSNRQGGRENDVEQTYRDAIRTGDLNAWTQLADWLDGQPGRKSDVEQAYRDAVAAGDPNARQWFVRWLGGQPGRETEVEQIYRRGLTARGDTT